MAGGIPSPCLLYETLTYCSGMLTVYIFLQLQEANTVDAVKFLMTRDKFDFLYAVGITNISTLAERDQIVQSLAAHFTVIAAKAQLDQIVEGLQVSPFFSILESTMLLCIMVFTLSAKLHNMLIPTVLRIMLFHLQVLGVYDLIKSHPNAMYNLFTVLPEGMNATDMIELCDQPAYSEQGSITREKEEQIVMFFAQFIYLSEGMIHLCGVIIEIRMT